jgi:pimeloyl-ACP methyl ester carboxylesterase
MLQRYGILAAARAVIWSLFEEDTPPPPRPVGGRPILLLHGFMASSQVLMPLEEHLRRTSGRPVVRLRLGDRLPLHLADIRASARRAQAALETLAAGTGFEYADVVGHSMGGLVAAYLLKCLDRGRRIRRVVTLGTPHQGTPLALLGVVSLGAISRAIWQMLPGAPFLRRLARLPVPEGSALLAVSGLDDAVVPPAYAEIAGVAGQENVALAGMNHFELVQSPVALDFIARALDDGLPGSDELPAAA